LRRVGDEHHSAARHSAQLPQPLASVSPRVIAEHGDHGVKLSSSNGSDSALARTARAAVVGRWPSITADGSTPTTVGPAARRRLRPRRHLARSPRRPTLIPDQGGQPRIGPAGNRCDRSGHSASAPSHDSPRRDQPAQPPQGVARRSLSVSLWDDLIAAHSTASATAPKRPVGDPLLRGSPVGMGAFGGSQQSRFRCCLGGGRGALADRPSERLLARPRLALQRREVALGRRCARPLVDGWDDRFRGMRSPAAWRRATRPRRWFG
jgi:hypothetical protein